MARFLVLFMVVLLSYGPALAQEKDQKVQISILPQLGESAVAHKGRDIPLIIQQNIEEGWHTYWQNPGDSGDFMRIDWTLPEGVIAHDLKWPVPTRIPYGPLVNFGYEKQANILGGVSIPVDFSEDILRIEANVKWLVCEKICIPESQKVSLVLPLNEAENSAGATTNAETDFLRQIRTAIPQAADWPASFTVASDDAPVHITVSVPQDIAGQVNADVHENAGIEFFPIDYGLTLHTAPTEIVLDPQQGMLKLTLANGDLAAADFETLDFVLKLGERSYRLTAKLEKAARPPEQTVTDIEKPQDVQQPQDTSETPQQAHVQDGFESMLSGALISMFGQEQGQFVLYLILAFLGGVILNLMPCVFPVLSMKALSIVKLSDSPRFLIWMNGVFYMLGILVSFAAIGYGLIALRSFGASIGWGFQLQNPAIVIAISWLLFAVALNLSGAYEITLGRAEGAGADLANKPGIVGAFFTGILATLVATPCTAPFMGTAFGAAIALPNEQALAIFLSLGFGLSFPYLLLCFIPALTRALPSPGAWMLTFKQFLAFPIYATVIWLIWVALRQIGDMALAYTLGGMLGLSFAFWMLAHARGKGRAGILLVIVSVLMIGAIFTSLACIGGCKQGNRSSFGLGGEGGETVSQQTRKELPYTEFTPQALQEALTQTKAPILVNMTASWCITCLVNERTSLNTQEIKYWMHDHNVTYIKGDWTNQDEAITQYLDQFGRNGVPLYVFYGAPVRGEEGEERPDPVVLPQILTKERIKNLIP